MKLKVQVFINEKFFIIKLPNEAFWLFYSIHIENVFKNDQNIKINSLNGEELRIMNSVIAQNGKRFV